MCWSSERKKRWFAVALSIFTQIHFFFFLAIYLFDVNKTFQKNVSWFSKFILYVFPKKIVLHLVFSRHFQASMVDWSCHFFHLCQFFCCGLEGKKRFIIVIITFRAAFGFTLGWCMFAYTHWRSFGWSLDVYTIRSLWVSYIIVTVILSRTELWLVNFKFLNFFVRCWLAAMWKRLYADYVWKWLLCGRIGPFFLRWRVDFIIIVVYAYSLVKNLPFVRYHLSLSLLCVYLFSFFVHSVPFQWGPW